MKSRIDTTLSWLERRRGDVVKAEDVARETGASVRTVYRHVAALRGKGHRVPAEAGVGILYVGGPACE